MGRTEVSIRQMVTGARVRAELLAGAFTLVLGLVCLGCLMLGAWVLVQFIMAGPLTAGAITLCMLAVGGGITGVTQAWQELDGIVDRVAALHRALGDGRDDE